MAGTTFLLSVNSKKEKKAQGIFKNWLVDENALSSSFEKAIWMAFSWFLSSNNLKKMFGSVKCLGLKDQNSFSLLDHIKEAKNFVVISQRRREVLPNDDLPFSLTCAPHIQIKPFISKMPTQFLKFWFLFQLVHNQNGHIFLNLALLKCFLHDWFPHRIRMTKL